MPDFLVVGVQGFFNLSADKESPGRKVGVQLQQFCNTGYIWGFGRSG